jgi:DNA-binding NarL/FixJ family response regulator
VRETLKLSFVILEDHPLLLTALGAQIRDLYPECPVVYEGKDVIAAADFCNKDTVAIVDLDLGDNRKAADVVAIIVAKGASVLVVSALGEPSTIESVMIAGAHGYMTKRANSGEFKEAIEAGSCRRNCINQDRTGKPVKSRTKGPCPICIWAET